MLYHNPPPLITCETIIFSPRLINRGKILPTCPPVKRHTSAHKKQSKNPISLPPIMHANSRGGFRKTGKRRHREITSLLRALVSDAIDVLRLSFSRSRQALSTLSRRPKYKYSDTRRARARRALYTSYISSFRS